MRDREAPPPVVTDHALLRYLERVIGLDVQAHRAEVARLVGQAVAKGASALVHEGFRYKISDFRVTTVIPVKDDRPPAIRDGEEA
jgi:hypothetical protein